MRACSTRSTTSSPSDGTPPGGPRTTSSRSRAPFALGAFDLAFRPGPPGHGARYVHLAGDRVLVDPIARRVLSSAPPPTGSPCLSLGAIEGAAVFAALLGDDGAEPAGSESSDLRGLYGTVNDDELGWASRAVQIAAFDRDHRFCGRCGGATAPSPTEHARACAACGATAYPCLSPAVIVLVERNDECLLARSSRFPPGMYAAIAGFVEPGETAEHAVERELAEEVGITATGIRYAGSQPWPFPHSLMLGFTAAHASGEVRADGAEIEAAGWFPADALPPLPAPGSIARRLIEEFRDRARTRGARRS